MLEMGEYNYGHDFLEELLTLTSEQPWESYNTNLNIPTQELAHDFYSNTAYYAPTSFPAANPFSNINPQTTTCFDSLPFDDQYHQTLNSFGDFCVPFGDDQAIQTDDSTLLFPCQDQDYYSVMDDDLAAAANSCKMESSFQSPEVVVPASFNVGSNISMEKRSTTRVKKLNGQPSKNLMAERRRRKRLNDRLSMLRSVVPKISKMDRTSILGDTIDYMKELLERINNLQEENETADSNHQPISIFKDHVKPNYEVLVRNSPKFDVERRDMDTRVEMCCATKPGLLLSTVTTLEALGLEIQQCVISCFNDFEMSASCSEETEQRGNISSEDIKQAIFRNAGYGGKCL